MKKSKINWTWKKVCASALTILGIGTLTSCYGVIENYSGISGTVTGNTDQDAGIEGIKVDLYKDGNLISSDYTDIRGRFFLDFEEGITGDAVLKFSDVDGELNGSWKDSELDISLDEMFMRIHQIFSLAAKESGEVSESL